MNQEFIPVILVHLGAALAALVLGIGALIVAGAFSFLPSCLLDYALWPVFGLS